MRKEAIGACLLLIVPLWAGGGADKTKKAYELIYDDVQILKKQVQDISLQLQNNAADLQLIKDQCKELSEIIRRLQTDQAGLKEDVKAVPAEYQALTGRIDQLSLELARISDRLMGLKGSPSPSSTAETKPLERGGQEPRKPEKKEGEAPKPVLPPSNLAPQDVYNMAYNDFLKGNFDLAIQGFKMYKDQFPDSPLADNALYWIGECNFSQRKFEAAISVFNELILTYPQGDRIAAAYLKKGLSFAEIGKKDEAIAAYKLLITKFPLEEETRIAQQKIKELTEK